MNTQHQLNKNRSVAFTGHRSVHSDVRHIVTLRLRTAIAKLYQRGYRNFYCGMAMGFDLLAAETTLSMKRQFPDISLTAVVPFRAQDERFPHSEKLRYRQFLAQADQVIMLSENYYRGCLLRRNDFMLDHSAHVIAYYDGCESGGTYYTCRRAESLALSVQNIF